MNKFIKYIFSLSFIILLVAACNDSFLDEKVLDKFSPQTLNNKLGYEAAAVGLYNQFSTFLTTTDDQTILGMFQLGTDIVWNPMGRSNGNARPYHEYSTLTPTDNASLKLWRYLYKLINNANLIIVNLESSKPEDMTQPEADAINAEAKFFRAYSYNMLVTLYGGVPLSLEPVSAPKTDYIRATVGEVNQTIVSDLLFSISKLGEIDQVKEARANKAMARQLLAEVYLRTNEPALAEKQCDSIFISNKFSLITNRYGDVSKSGDAYSDMFRVGKQRRSKGNTEVIWNLQLENPTDVSYNATGSPQQRRIWGAGYHDISGMIPCDSLGGRGLTRMRLDNWVLYELYEKNDMRNSKYSIHRQHYFNNNRDAKYSTVLGKPVPYGKDTTLKLADNTDLKINALDTVYKLAPYTLKWGQFDSRDEFGYGMWKDINLMRLGETYLLRAEARFKQNNLQGAADDINVIRGRANASTVTSGDITLDFILDERARELVGEENRRMTLVRTGTLIARVKAHNGETKLANGNIETSNGISAKNVLLPIPQTEIDLNKDAILEQNPDYE